MSGKPHETGSRTVIHSDRVVVQISGTKSRRLRAREMLTEIK
jgi:hypothetical protein